MSAYRVRGHIRIIDPPQSLVVKGLIPGMSHKCKDDYLMVLCLERCVSDNGAECRFAKGDWVEVTMDYTDESELVERGVKQ